MSHWHSTVSSNSSKALDDHVDRDEIRVRGAEGTTLLMVEAQQRPKREALLLVWRLDLHAFHEAAADELVQAARP